MAAQYRAWRWMLLTRALRKCGTSLRRVLALIFQVCGFVLFIPWLLAAERGADFHI
jgi:hypothetical protein